MTVVGTAGHVDHGKSTLLQALTGRDPDRWEEEKRRGLTIDLGFVWTTLPSGREVSFVDVPGHERFIKNMLAGIEAIDIALFVVAADEGWMPQSEEHLAVLDLLDIRRGVVALTKTDRVDVETVELATLETMEKLEGTSLQGAPLVPVAAPLRRGLDELLATLDSLLTEQGAGDDPRLWIDRRFTVAGAGTVVTGTLLGGSVAVEDALVVYPHGTEVRVRGIESHEQSLTRVGPHRRVALNLVGAPDDLQRGAMLGRRGRWLLTDRFTARIRPARYVDELGEKGAYQVHVGTVAVPARLRWVDEGSVIDLDRPLPLRYGDHFIVRETGRRAVVAGGVVLDPAPPRRGAALSRSTRLPADLHPVAAADTLAELRGRESLSRLIAHTGVAPTVAHLVGDSVVAGNEMERLSSLATEEVERFHATTPLRPGLPLATLASRLGVSGEVAARVVAHSPHLSSDGAVATKVGHSSALSPQQEKAWEEARRKLAEAGLQAPRVADLDLEPELLHSLIRSGKLVAVSEELVYLPEDAERLRERIAAMPAGFTVADFRDALGLSRKYAVPILEWADAEGLTRRRGDTRIPV